MGQVTVFSGPERRRRWSDEERLQIMSEAFAPGVIPTCIDYDPRAHWRRPMVMMRHG